MPDIDRGSADLGAETGAFSLDFFQTLRISPQKPKSGARPREMERKRTAYAAGRSGNDNRLSHISPVASDE
jgi:hypothetical protein